MVDKYTNLTALQEFLSKIKIWAMATFSPKMSILSYGNSTWDDFIAAYNDHSVVYCRASSNSNPASGSQTRLAFMAYVNNADTPTEVEFQYYRSVSSHSASQQGDQVYVYKLTKTGGWTVTTREAMSKIATEKGLDSTYSSGTIKLKTKLKAESQSSLTAADKGSTADREYAVGLDASGNLSVNIPWTGTITGITMNGASKGTSGVVDLGTVITEHQDISGKADKADLATVATSGSYNDLTNKPTIPAAVAVKGDAESTYRTGDVNLTKANIGLGNVGNFKAVSTVASQGLTDTEKSNARTNIGAGTITGVKMNGASKGTSGVVDLGTVITAHQDISGKQDKITPVTPQTTQAVYPIKIDAQGHITGYGSAVTIPGNNRKSFYATCSTAADVKDKVATLADNNGWELRPGTIVGVKFTNTNTYASTAEAPVTLNVNSTGAKPIYYNNAVSPTGANTGIYGYANRVIYYMYDGTNWCWIGDGRHDGNSDTKVRQTLKTDNVNRPLLMAYSDNTVTTGNVDNVSYRNNSIYANASTGTITATKFTGQADATLQSSDISIANGDKLVVTDSSNSNKVSRTSVSFDGSTTNKFLSKKGTWEDAGDALGNVAMYNATTVIDNIEAPIVMTSITENTVFNISGTTFKIELVQ